jgi:hypothetical protein
MMSWWVQNEIALEKSKAIGRLNELEKSLKTKLHRLRDKNEVIMTDELGKIKDINSQAKKRLKPIFLLMLKLMALYLYYL